MCVADTGQLDDDDPIAVTRRHLQPGLALAQKFTGRGAYEVTADGAIVTLSDGRQLIDFGSYAVTLLGHRPPAVVAAVHRQLDLLPTATRSLPNPTTAAMAQRLCRVLARDKPAGARLERVWFGLSGSDAVEAALKLARLATGRREILAVEGGFHGKSMGALAATWPPRYRTGLDDLLVGVVHVPFDAPSLEPWLAEHEVAGLVFEPIQGEGGVRPLDADRLRRWADEVRRAGGFVLSDEVQVGMGRCGPLSVALDEGIDPDAVLFGKALGGGVMPLSAVVASRELYQPLLDDPFVHSATFSGHPLSAAGLAAIDELEALRPRASALAASCARGLAMLRHRYPETVREIRGRGLLWGIELASPAVAGRVLTGVSAGGLLVSPCLGRPEVIRLLPPMITTDDQLAAALDILDRAVDGARTV